MQYYNNERKYIYIHIGFRRKLKYWRWEIKIVGFSLDNISVQDTVDFSHGLATLQLWNYQSKYSILGLETAEFKCDNQSEADGRIRKTIWPAAVSLSLPGSVSHQVGGSHLVLSAAFSLSLPRSVSHKVKAAAILFNKLLSLYLFLVQFPTR